MSQFKRAVTESQKIERRQRIMNSAKKLFDENEFAKINIMEIATLANVSKGTVFIYFKTKEEIFIDILIEEFERWSDTFISELEEVNSAVLIRSLQSIVMENTLLVRLLAISNSILEYNISEEKAIQYRSLFQSRLQSLGSQLDNQINYFLPGDGESFMMYCFIIITGLHQITNPAPLLQKVVKEHNMNFYKIDFNQTLANMLETQLHGIRVKNENEKGDCTQ